MEIQKFKNGQWMYKHHVAPDEWVTTKQACRDGELCLFGLFLLSIYSSTLCIQHSYGKPITDVDFVIAKVIIYRHSILNDSCIHNDNNNYSITRLLTRISTYFS